MSAGRISIAVVGVLALALLLGSVFVINEREQAFLVQFGEVVGDPVQEAGLHWKVPLIQQVRRFEKRFLEWDGEPTELPTRDKRFIVVNAYARWWINDPIRFYERLGNELGAQTRLDDIIDGETRNAIASYDLVELVRLSNRTPAHDDSLDLAEPEIAPVVDDSDEFKPGAFFQIEVGRERIREEILEAAQARTTDLGIEVLDIQFKRINYIAEVEAKVHERMIAERQRIADRIRSEGQGEASRILGERDRELKRIESDAFRRAQEIEGRADAEATTIYAAAYDRSADSRRLYEFVRSMDALRSTVDEETTLVLSTDGELHGYLTGRP